MRHIIFIILAIVLCASGCAAVHDENIMYITCFDVGQADSFLLQCDGMTLLMDTGTEEDGLLVAAELKRMGINSIDYLMITHFDKDHVGGAAKIIREFDIGTIFRPVYMKASEEVTAFNEAAAENAETEIITLSEKYSFMLGAAELTVHTAASELYEKDPSNNSSLVTEIFHGENSMLFTGDVEKERIEELLNEDFRWDYDFLKVPHHGKHEKILKEFFAKVSAESSVITCSNKNPEEAKTLADLDEAGTKYYLTKYGAIRIQSDGEKLRINQ